MKIEIFGLILGLIFGAYYASTYSFYDPYVVPDYLLKKVKPENRGLLKLTYKIFINRLKLKNITFSEKNEKFIRKDFRYITHTLKVRKQVLEHLYNGEFDIFDKYFN